MREHSTACNLHMLGGQEDDSMRGIYWFDASRSDKFRYNCCLHQRYASAYESQNSRCSWTVYDVCSTMTGTKNGVAAQIKKLNEKCLLVHFYCHSLKILLSGIQKIFH